MRAGQNACLYRSAVRPDPADRAYVGAFALKDFQKILAWLILPDRSGDRDSAIQIQQVVCRIRCASRQADQVFIFQYKDRRLARNPGDAAIEKLVSDQIPDY